MTTTFFISYADEDRNHIAEICESIHQKAGAEFIDVRPIVNDETATERIDFRKNVRSLVQSANRFILVWSEAAAHSAFVNYEAGLASALGKPILVIAPQMHTPPLPFPLGNIQIVKLEDWEGLHFVDEPAHATDRTRMGSEDVVMVASSPPLEEMSASASTPNPSEVMQRVSQKSPTYLSLNNVSVRYDSHILFEDVTTAFTPGRRYAITGPNGVGRSALMKILTGEIEPEKGSVSRPRKMGVLSQDQFAFDAHRVMDTVIMGNRLLWEALQERESLYAKDPKALTDSDGMRLGELEGIVGDEGGYTAEVDAAILLDGLDIPEELHDQKMSELQVGQKMRVLLAQALFGYPDVLLLNEPTKKLDLDSIHWLQAYLRSYEGCLILISHDRHFLNEVCTHTADIDYQTVITYTGSYDDMVLVKTQVRSRIESSNAERETKIIQLNEFIARFSAGHPSLQERSRRKEVEHLHTSELAKSNIQRPFIRFDVPRPSGRRPLEVERLITSYLSETGRFQDFHYFTSSVSRGEKIALIGRNGAGKTTLLQSLIRNAPGLVETSEEASEIDNGTVTWGHEVSVGYFSQDHILSIPRGVSVIEWLHNCDPAASQAELRGLLSQMLFDREDDLKDTEALSGDEAARLIFCRLMLQKPNFLVLDEPTNHLDLESINALNIALQRYPGTLILVTHDHDVIDEVATRIWHLKKGGIEDFKGSYEHYVGQFSGPILV